MTLTDFEERMIIDQRLKDIQRTLAAKHTN